VTIRPLMICTLVFALLAGTAEAKDYYAERFDSRVEAARGGTIRVTETMRLHFRGGTFTQFYREIPTRLTDGVEIVSAAMDGVVLPSGTEPGHVQVAGSSRIRVTWRFAPVTDSSHNFELTYVVRGVIRQEDDADMLAWRTLRAEHAYRIDSSRSVFEFPAEPIAPPIVEARRAGYFSATVDGTRAYVDARTIRQTGWIEARIRLPRGSLIDTPPVWQQRELFIRSQAGMWIIVAAIVLVAGLVVLFAVRQRYDAPPSDVAAAWTGSAPPDPLPPAMAGALITNGRPHLEHAMAAFFSLAERGELTIEERPRSFGQSNFVLTRNATGRPLAEHEQRALDIIFTGSPGPESSVGLGKARSRLTRHFSKFSTALEREMTAAALMDEDRRSVRTRFMWVGVAALIVAAPMPILLSFFVNEFGGWPMLIPAALAVVGVTALIFYAAHTPLSNDAVRRAQYWRGFRKYLQDVARDREAPPPESTVRQWLPFAVAIGVAPAWSAYLKRHRAAAPPWFRAAADADSGKAFAMFVGIGGSGHSGGAHGGAGGGGSAAGGGASGAS
jgi:uncharacterized membrane protein YgcG